MTLEQLRRKRNQAWELAGLARQDGDMADCERHTNMAREYGRQVNQLLREQRGAVPAPLGEDELRDMLVALAGHLVMLQAQVQIGDSIAAIRGHITPERMAEYHRLAEERLMELPAFSKAMSWLAAHSKPTTPDTPDVGEFHDEG